MPADQWKKVEELFERASALPSEERTAFLNQACSGDAGLRGEVESLLNLVPSAASFLEGSPISSIRERPKALALTAGSRLGPYEIVALVGAGGMGEVYRARDMRLNREVAIKVLGEAVAADRDRRARFEKEAHAVASLNHPNIVSLFDVGTEGDTLYTVSELIEGESLRGLLRRGPATLRKTIEIAVQMADGMAAAHAAGITHRDLKPENIMVSNDGRVKILDFGLARQVATTSSEKETLTTHDTQPGTVMGTLNYMSPEQARGIPVNYHSDQFSFGLILYELVSGNRAFQKETTVHTLAAIISEEPPPIEAKLPAPLRWVIDRCLAKEASERYESTRDLFYDLRSLRDHLSDAYASAGAEPVRQTKSGHRLWKWVATTACILFAVDGALLTRRDVGQDLSRYRYTPFAISPEGQSRPFWSPDGKSVAYESRRQVFIRSLNSPVATQLTSFRDYAHPKGWSPDSRRVLFIGPAQDATAANATEALYSVAALGGEPELLMPVPDNDVPRDVSPDNQAVAVVGIPEAGKATVLISSPLGSPFRPYEPSPFAAKTIGGYTQLRFSPDGKKLLWTRADGSGSEEAWLLPYPPGKSAPQRILTRFPSRRLTADVSWLPDSRHLALALSTTGKALDCHLWIADIESDDAYQITGGTTTQFQVTVAPNGKQMVYAELRVDEDITSVSLLDGKSQKLIASDVLERMPGWAAKTEKFAYVTDRNGPPEIWLRSGDGSDQPLITQKDFPGNLTRYLLNPALSPDGKRLIFTRWSDEGAIRTWITYLSGGVPQRLNESAMNNELGAVWSPDGQRFAEIVNTVRGPALFLIKVGSSEKPIMIRERLNDWLPDWSPMGEWLTFNDDSGWHLISPDGKKVQPLGRIDSPYLAFSKDGKLLYGIRSDKTTLFSLNISTMKVSDIRELGADLAPSSDMLPSIRFSVAPDGRSIVYTTDVSKMNLWILEGFHQPGLLSRLGLNWSKQLAE
jgi:serine/threonine protein kinase